MAWVTQIFGCGEFNDQKLNNPAIQRKRVRPKCRVCPQSPRPSTNAENIQYHVPIFPMTARNLADHQELSSEPWEDRYGFGTQLGTILPPPYTPMTAFPNTEGSVEEGEPPMGGVVPGGAPPNDGFLTETPLRTPDRRLRAHVQQASAQFNEQQYIAYQVPVHHDLLNGAPTHWPPPPLIGPVYPGPLRAIPYGGTPHGARRLDMRSPITAGAFEVPDIIARNIQGLNQIPLSFQIPRAPDLGRAPDLSRGRAKNRIVQYDPVILGYSQSENRRSEISVSEIPGPKLTCEPSIIQDCQFSSEGESGQIQSENPPQSENLRSSELINESSDGIDGAGEGTENIKTSELALHSDNLDTSHPVTLGDDSVLSSNQLSASENSNSFRILKDLTSRTAQDLTSRVGSFYKDFLQRASYPNHLWASSPVAGYQPKPNSCMSGERERHISARDVGTIVLGAQRNRETQFPESQPSSVGQQDSEAHPSEQPNSADLSASAETVGVQTSINNSEVTTQTLLTTESMLDLPSPPKPMNLELPNMLPSSMAMEIEESCKSDPVSNVTKSEQVSEEMLMGKYVKTDQLILKDGNLLLTGYISGSEKVVEILTDGHKDEVSLNMRSSSEEEPSQSEEQGTSENFSENHSEKDSGAVATSSEEDVPSENCCSFGSEEPATENLNMLPNEELGNRTMMIEMKTSGLSDHIPDSTTQVLYPPRRISPDGGIPATTTQVCPPRAFHRQGGRCDSKLWFKPGHFVDVNAEDTRPNNGVPALEAIDDTCIDLDECVWAELLQPPLEGRLPRDMFRRIPPKNVDCIQIRGCQYIQVNSRACEKIGLQGNALVQMDQEAQTIVSGHDDPEVRFLAEQLLVPTKFEMKDSEYRYVYDYKEVFQVRRYGSDNTYAIYDENLAPTEFAISRRSVTRSEVLVEEDSTVANVKEPQSTVLDSAGRVCVLELRTVEDGRKQFRFLSSSQLQLNFNDKQDSRIDNALNGHEWTDIKKLLRSFIPLLRAVSDRSAGAF